MIRSRDPFNYFIPTDFDQELAKSIALSSRNGFRKMFTQYRGPRTPRRVKACMKQVVSGAFSGFLNKELENKIVLDLIDESRLRPDKNKSAQFHEKKVQEATARLVVKIKLLLESRARIYLDKIVTRLFDPDVELEWHLLENNCQRFTDTILTHDDFGAIFALGSEPKTEPLYLISFVCRPEGYHRTIVQTKYDVPNGLTEEYVLRYRSGRHDDADIVDTLSEYWHDWGAFGGHLYKHQDVFPWDCTEAYGKYPTTCNNCNIAKHVWAFPFDSWSIVQLHLQKDRRWYRPAVEHGKTLLTDREWMENRFKIMLAQDVLIRGASAMARTPAVRSSCDWIAWRDNAMFDRVKLGGIHRAQPCSHHFEQRRYIEWYIAGWAHLKREDQIKAYEAMRDYRVQLQDVPKKKSSDSGQFDVEAMMNGLSNAMEWMSLSAAVAGVDGGSADSLNASAAAIASASGPHSLTAVDPGSGGSYDGGNSDFGSFGF